MPKSDRDGSYLAALWEHPNLCIAFFGVQFLTEEGRRLYAEAGIAEEMAASLAEAEGLLLNREMMTPEGPVLMQYWRSPGDLDRYARRMPHGHDSHDGALLLNLEIDVVRRTRHQDATDLPVPDRPVRKAGLGSFGESIENCRHFIVEESRAAGRFSATKPRPCAPAFVPQAPRPPRSGSSTAARTTRRR